MTNYGYREKYKEVISQMYHDGRREVIQEIYYFLKEELTNYLDEKLGNALEQNNYTFADSIHDSVYCMPYHECIVIMEYLTDFNTEIETTWINPVNNPNSPDEQLETDNITSHITEVMRNWIFNGINSLFYYYTDSELTVKENLEKLEKQHNDVLKIKS